MEYKMLEVSNNEIVEIAKDYNKNGIPWHNHFLAVKCIYNKSGKFQVVIENEQTGEVFVSSFEKQPSGTLKLLEDLFFLQNKEN